MVADNPHLKIPPPKNKTVSRDGGEVSEGEPELIQEPNHWGNTDFGFFFGMGIAMLAVGVAIALMILAANICSK